LALAPVSSLRIFGLGPGFKGLAGRVFARGRASFRRIGPRPFLAGKTGPGTGIGAFPATSLFAFDHRTCGVYEISENRLDEGMKRVSSILVVDDDDQLRHLFSTCLRGQGYEVLEAAGGEQGLHLAQTRFPDLVLLDVQLPDISGVEVCRRIKTDPAMRDVFVALCSGEAISDEHKVNGFQTGADEYLVKPFGIQELLARVQTLIRLRNTTAALRTSEEHHRRLIDILPDAVCLIHPKGRLLAVNSQAAAMLGFSHTAELLHKSIFDLTPPEEHERIQRDFVVALKAGIIRNLEYQMLKNDGTLFEVELSATVSLGINNQPAGLLSVVRDITERKQAQEALQASDARFRQLADHIREVFWMSNADKSKIIYVSPAYEEIWGQSCESLYASPANWFAAIHPEDRQRVLENTRVKQIAGEYDEIFRILRPDGSMRWIQDRAFPIRDDAGNIYRIVGIADDITKRKQAWDALGESEARKRAIMQAALDGIITIDHEGRMVELNSAAEKIFGHSQSALIGENVMEVIPNSFRAWFQTGLDNCFAGEKGPVLGSRVEMPALRADGSRFSAEFTITRIRLAGHPMFTLYIRDITQRKHAEAELRSLPQRIIKAQEAERSRIAQELHDGINQLIASVKMRLRKVEGSLPDLKPAAREILSRCDRLLVKVLEENRRIAHNLRPTDLDNLGLAAACSSFCNDIQLRTHLKIDCRISASQKRLPPVVELHLFRIVQEAINNIDKHAKANSVSLQIRYEGNFVVLHIQDDGQGFDAKTIHVGKRARHGLGLTNMRERALSLGGSYEIKSVPGEGTTITVRVPVNTSARGTQSKRERVAAE
jgi:PAS domain S-box-containing protein